ncbi:hypothetical protein L873DRAFT_559324 [Choiromyces venosus 120613-1]|uniref:Uncharacterized protein n=1 Tax=Choiromyces venosus 120613-1 TaxID=1336337 RepID=A0A3N4JU42_9PEZI|nr:hypothetical protein L873DRAFT_559324 [Choiromyces venosus 120613-1]
MEKAINPGERTRNSTYVSWSQRRCVLSVQHSKLGKLVHRKRHGDSLAYFFILLALASWPLAKFIAGMSVAARIQCCTLVDERIGAMLGIFTFTPALFCTEIT